MDFFGHVIDFLQSSAKINGESFPFTWGGLLLKFVLPIIVYIVFYKLVLLLVKRLLKKSSLKEKPKNRIFIWSRRILRILFAVLLVILVSLLLGAKILKYLELFYRALSKPFFESGNTKISVITLLFTIPIFYLASWASKAVRGVIDRSILKRSDINASKKFTISNLVRYGVLVVVLIIGLSIIGINLSSLAVIFGVLGIGLGFGLQNVVANFFAGIILIITHPIKEGDRVFVMESEGTVMKIKMLSSVINTIKNETIIVPNSQLTGDKVYNFSYDDRSILIENRVEVAYTADLEKAVKVIREVGTRCPSRLSGSQVIVRVASFESSGILLKLFTTIPDVNDKYDVLSWINLEIWKAFRKNGIEIPFPQVDLHFRNPLPKD